MTRWWRGVWPALISLVLAACAAPSPRQAREDLLEALKRRAAPAQVEGVVKARAFASSDGPVAWIVVYSGDRLPAHLDRVMFRRDESDAARRRLAWLRSLNADLLEATKDALHETRPGFDPQLETDVTMEIYEGEGGDAAELGFSGGGAIFRRHDASFRGSRLLLLEQAPPGVRVPDPIPDECARDLLLQAEIVPDKLVWRPHETITGRVVLRNAGRKPLRLSPSQPANVELLDQSGNPPPVLPSRALECGTGLEADPTIVLKPGQERARPFRFKTDPLSTSGAHKADAGRYRLRFPDLSTPLNIPTDTIPVAIEVRNEGGRAPTARVIQFGAGADRISVLREDGSLQSYDLNTGTLRCAGATEAPDSLTALYSSGTFSRDAARFARLLARAHAPPLVVVYDLAAPDGVVRKIASLEASYPKSSFWSMGFDAGGRRLRLGTQTGLDEIDIQSGARTCVSLLDSAFVAAVEGAHIVCLKGNTASLVPLAGGAETLLTMPGTGPVTPHFAPVAGAQRLYLTTDGIAEPVMFGYDGAFIGKIGKPGLFPACDSTDGKLVALLLGGGMYYRQGSGLEVWETSGSKRIFATDDERMRAPIFAGSTTLLVCGMVVTGDEGARWLEDTFEVYEASTGKLVRRVTLPPGTPPEQEADAER